MSTEKPSAETLFAEWLEARESGGGPPFDEFVQARSAHADALRALHAEWRRDQRHPEPDVDATVFVGDEARAPEAWAEFLANLERLRPEGVRYRFLGEVDKGGMGVILKVRDESLRRNLAMKVILGRGESGQAGATPSVDPKALGRFLEEAQVTAQLDHPGIVPVHELGLDDHGRIFFTMKLIKGGEDLRKVLAKVRSGADGWSTTRILSVLLRACEAVAFAHSRGVLHRDLKPGNIMVGRFGEVYVMDWGLARVLGQDDTRDLAIVAPPPATDSIVNSERRDVASDTPDSPLLTRDGLVAGTPQYMAPEQARGALAEMGPHTDVYGMGSILYELVTGQAPYLPPGAAVDARVVWLRSQEGPPRPLRELAPDVPAELEAICEKAMERDAADRYRDMTELAADLRAYVEGRVVGAYATGAIPELRKWVRRNRVLASTIAVAMIATIALAGWALVERNAAEVERERANENERLAEERADAAESAVYLASIGDAVKWIESHDGSAARRALDNCPEHLRGWEWHHLGMRADPARVVRDSFPSGGHTRYAAVSDSGDFMFVRDFELVEGEVDTFQSLSRVLDSRSGATRELPPSVFGLAAAISGDGKVLALAGLRDDGNTREYVVKLRSFSELDLIDQWEMEGDHIVAIAVDANANHVVTRQRDGVVRHRTLSSGVTREWRIPAYDQDGVDMRDAVISPGGMIVAIVAFDLRVCLWTPETGAEHWLDLPRNFAATEIAFAPDGRTLIVGSLGGPIACWDVESERFDLQMVGHDETVKCLATTPDGSRVVSAAGPDVRVWNARTGKNESVLLGNEDTVIAVGASAERVTSVTSSGAVRTWSLEARDGFTETFGSNRPTRVGFDDSGRRLAVASALRVTELRAGPVLVFDAATGEPLRSFSANRFAFHPTADQILVGAGIDESALLSGDVPWLPMQSVELRDLVSGEVVVDFGAAPWGANSLAISHDGARVAAGLGSVTMDDGMAVAGPGMAAGPGFQNRVGYIARDPLVRLWSSDGTLVAEMDAHRGPVSAVAFDPSGSRLYSASTDGVVRVWRAEDGAPIGVLAEDSEDSILALAVDGSGQTLAVARYSGRVDLVDLATGRIRVVLEHEETVDAVALSADGKRVATSSWARLRLWDAVTGTFLVDVGRAGEGVAFDSSGTRVATAARVYETDPVRAETGWENARVLRRTWQLVERLATQADNPLDLAVLVAQEEGLGTRARTVASAWAEVPRAIDLERILSAATIASLFDGTVTEDRCVVVLDALDQVESRAPGIPKFEFTLIFRVLAEQRLGRLEDASATLARFRSVLDALQIPAEASTPFRGLADAVDALILARRGQRNEARERLESARTQLSPGTLNLSKVVDLSLFLQTVEEAIDVGTEAEGD